VSGPVFVATERDRAIIAETIDSMSTDAIRIALADFHDGETVDYAAWAWAWAIDSLADGIPAADVLAVLRGES
jgi:hypothetical protein